MNGNKSAGAAKVVMGKFESAAGDALDDPAMEARGAVRQAGGYAQGAVGSAQDTLGEIADQAMAAVSKAGDAYARVSGAARGVVQTVEDKPFMAVGIGMAFGLLLGLFIAARRPEIIYVKPRD